MKNKLMSIIVLNWCRKHYTKQTIESIVKKTTIPHELILVDNNSAPESGVKDYLASVNTSNTNAKEVKYVFNNKNLGVAGGRNSGLVVANGDYLVTIDDDVKVPDKWDVLLKQACDKVAKLGITGVSVEPIKYPIKVINGVRIRPKTVGNLGGACLCIPRRVFRSVGYYRIFGQYGLEDSDYFVRLNHLGLMSAYIEPKGIHLDTDADKAYRAAKDRAHKKRSPQLCAFAAAKAEYQKTGNVYVPNIEYDPDDPKWSNFEKFDGLI
jgi:GT2 family glycosyltransferase